MTLTRVKVFDMLMMKFLCFSLRIAELPSMKRDRLIYMGSRRTIISKFHSDSRWEPLMQWIGQFDARLSSIEFEGQYSGSL